MNKTRRVLAIDGCGQFIIIEQPVPELKPGQIRLRVGASLVSPGTELGRIPQLRANPDPKAEVIPFGYSNSGEVLEVGEGVTRFQPGDRVACIGGGYAYHTTEAVVPQNLAAALPDNLSYADGSFSMLSATALQAVRRAEPEIGENFLIVGLGVVGQLCVQWARLAGTHVMGWDRLPLRLDIAQQCGCDRVVKTDEEDGVEAAKEFSRDYGMDCGIMAMGGEGTEAFNQVVKTLKVSPDTHQMGRVVMVGGAIIQHQFAAALGNIDVRSAARTGAGYHDDAWEHGAEYPSVFIQWTTRRNLEEGLRFLSEGRMQVAPIITNRVSLDEAPAACEKLVSCPGEAVGVVIEP